MPPRLIQTQHVQITPVLLWQGCDEQNPPSDIERLGPQAILLLTCRSLGAPLGFLALLLREPQADAACAHSLSFVVDPDVSATDLSGFGTTTFEPGVHGAMEQKSGLGDNCKTSI